MARNRQRAKDRKQKLRNENVPGSLDHASGEVDEFQAAIVAGASAAEEPDGAELTDLESLDEEQSAPGAGNGARAAHKPSGSRLGTFARGCVAELKRVDWPDRRATGQATAVVMGFVLIAGAYLGLADTVAQKIIDFIL